MSTTTSSATSRSLPSQWFFVGMGLVPLSAVAIGFSRTYVAPVLRGTFAGPRILHVHGALALSWVLLFLVQPTLVRTGRIRWHRKLGRLGLPVAIALGITMIPAGFFQATRDAAAGAGPTGISSILGTITAAMLFVTLVVAGIVTRRDRDAHARWMLLATILVIWPAWFRFRHWFPEVPRPDVWFGLVLAFIWIIVAMLRDKLVRGTIHPVLLWGGSAVILEQSFETLVFDSPPWRAIAQAIYGWLQPILGVS